MKSALHSLGSPAVFGREAELRELRQRIEGHTSFVVHGDSGAGKTFLIRRLENEFAQPALYCPDSTSGQSIFRELAGGLLHARNQLLRRACRGSNPDALGRKTTLALRGLVLDALDTGKYWVILDHLCRTSASLASDVRQIIFRGSTPVVVVTRSAHMEDLGYLISFFALQSERMHIRAFNRPLASEFATQVASRMGLLAGNEAEFLHRVVQLSGGLPGVIESLIRMALLPKYRSGGYIKLAPLYIDFRLAWHAANAY